MRVIVLPTALLAAGEYDALRNFLEHSLTGAALTDEAVRDTLGVGSTGFDWKTDGGGRGYVVSTIGTELHYGEVDLQVRNLTLG